MSYFEIIQQNRNKYLYLQLKLSKYCDNYFKIKYNNIF